MDDTTLTAAVLAVLVEVPGFVAAGHALLWKRRPQAAFGWIAVCLGVPVGGALLYFLFGINRVQARARKLRAQTPEERPPAPPPIARPGLQALADLGRAVTGLPLTGGNRVDALHNGEAAYPAMLDAIAGASTRVYLSTYIFDSDDVGREFVRALSDAVARGVDELYSWPRAHRLLRAARVPCARFLPPRLLPPAFLVNLRNHRKILVVDGRVGFTGGMNIRERHLVRGAHPSPVVDVHFRVAGPVAGQMERAFLADWRFVTREDRPVPSATVEADGSARCRVVVDGPDGRLDRLTTLLIGALGAARERVAIMTPYFLPPRELVSALQATAMRGVDVTVILPARNNLPYVHRATRHMLWELLERGVHVCFQPPPFAHSKFLLVDDEYALVGSANLDPRSLRLNFELNVEIYDAEVVAALGAHFEATRRASTAVTLDEVDRRPLAGRLLDGLAWLFSPYL